MNLENLFEIKNPEYWKRIYEYCYKHKIPVGDAYACLLHLCGMPIWEAADVILSHKDEAESYFTDFDEPNCRYDTDFNFQYYQDAAALYFSSGKLNDFKQFATELDEKLTALDKEQYTWKFSDSERELRNVIHQSRIQLQTKYGYQTGAPAVILKAVKELNAMYGYAATTSSNTTGNQQQVIFMGADKFGA